MARPSYQAEPGNTSSQNGEARYREIYERLHTLLEKKKLETVARHFRTHQESFQGQQFIVKFTRYIDQNIKLFDDEYRNLMNIIHDPEKFIPDVQPTADIEHPPSTKEAIAVLSKLEGFRFLREVVDLGPPSKKLPKKIPAEKKWNARELKYQGLEPKEKAILYLEENWQHYPIYHGFFENRGGHNFYAYLTRNDLRYLIPTSCEAEIIVRLYQS